MNNFLKIKNSFKSLISSILGQYIISVLIISITAFLCSPLANTNNYHVVSFILLFVVSFLSTFMGIRPVLLASTLSALAWNFFFIPPHLTFHIEKTEDILIFGLFFIIALLNGVLTTRVRRQEKIAIEREKRTNALFQLTKELSKTSGIKEVVDVSQKEIRKNFDVNPIIIVQDGNEKLVLPESATLRLINFETAQWSFSNLEKAGANTDHFASNNFTYFPLFGSKIKSGIIAINNYNRISGDKISFWDTFVVQISNALEREFLIEMAQKVRFLDESDRLYKTLFNSISHELRIPVATIMGASDSIINSENSKEVQMALCNEIFTASLRLNRLIENLLNISRLESGYLSIRLDWHDINDLINKVLDELEEELKNFIIK
jgi:K+-sensing histidine kinase KdpD